VTVHQDERLARVAVLRELLRAAVHVADHGLRATDHLSVELEDDAEHPVGGGVLRPDVEDHLLGLQALAVGDLDVQAAAANHPVLRGGGEGGALLGVHAPPFCRTRAEADTRAGRGRRA
jgi:hypothetical protein